MKKTHPPVFISGPHGGGKSTLTERLKSASDMFLENDFDIDFTIDFPGIASLSHFERSLMRVYHRFFIAHYAQSLAKRNLGKIILTNRTIYDSEAYINVYKKLGWITKDQFKKLNFIIKNFAYRPHAIILNPSPKTIAGRLNSRQQAKTRMGRDKIFKNEDSDMFIKNLHLYFKKFKNENKIVYIEDNDDVSIKKIITWAKNLK